ncbi:MAG TPA: DEAD/DEAH box helicase family protein [Mycobacteriales bacterium]|nr:DEAD/DEAH box helicase family protein [Mycobacteriales bacterium]
MTSTGQTLQAANVWARETSVAGNPIRQLLVPAGPLLVDDSEGHLSVTGAGGRWPASKGSRGPDDGPLTAVIPTLVSANARVTWSGSRALTRPEEVTESYAGAIGFAAPGEPGSLRRPQFGALHSILGYWTSDLGEPAVVVMPTGTGKTETMIAVMVAAQIRRLLVIVPSAALRLQIAAKFETLGVLPAEDIVTNAARRPIVGRLEHGLTDPDEAARFADACNVVVATPNALEASSPAALERFYREFSHLVVDEAHHAPAATWARIIGEFDTRPVLLFTATPYREDRRALPGRIIYRFPLRAAQADGYFTKIDYRAVLSLEGADTAVAELAVSRLRSDLAAGHDHILLARARSVTRATELGTLYAEVAPEFGPRVLHDALSARKRKEVFAALADRSCRIVICVDMLGEGFDLPQLKIAAIHDVKKSLGPMIQFIGRFSRTRADTDIGTASVFVARDPALALSPLRDLLREDADWNLLLRDITDRATEVVETLGVFERSFADAPDEVPVTLLAPKMSAVAHLAPTATWHPERALDLYPADTLVGGRLATGADGSIAWFVVEHRDAVPWADVGDLQQTTYELVILYFDARRRLLYVHGSNKTGTYADLAEAVLGDGSHPIKGLPAFRVLAHLDRLVPTNVGLLDARDHFNRFSMHVGSDVVEALDEADRHGKTQTHIVTSGFDDGERVTISAALSGRFWSVRSAPNLKAWADWCDQQGGKLLDNGIDLKQVLDGFIIPVDLTTRPPNVLLALEWPWTIVGGLTAGVSVSYQEATFQLLDIGFEVDDFGTSGPFQFSLVTPAWRLRYRAEFEPAGLTYSPVGDDAEVASRPGAIPLQQWINRNKPTLFLDGDRMITAEDRLLAPRHDLAPFDRSRLQPLDWTGVDIRVESQGPTRRTDSIQARMSTLLRADNDFDVLLDDDRAGEAADLVGLSVHDGDLRVTLVHCKYSSSTTPGARVADLYELCGQAMRGAKWRQQGTVPLLAHLDRRAQTSFARTGVSPYEVGDIHALFRIRELALQLRPRFRTILVQPGLSASAATDEQLRLIAGASSYVHAVTKGEFEVICSE